MKRFPTVMVGDLVERYHDGRQETITRLTPYDDSFYADFGNLIVTVGGRRKAWRADVEVVG